MARKFSMRIFTSKVQCTLKYPKAEKSNVKENALALAEEALPAGILTSKKSISDLAKYEIKQHHRWLGVVYHLVLNTNIIIMLFMQSITYNITKGDDAYC